MESITLEYKQLGLFWKKRFEAKLPSSWAEMSGPQIIALVAYNRGRINDSKLLQVFLGISPYLAKRIGDFQKFMIIKNLNNLKDIQPINRFLINKIKGFKAPQDKLKGITFGAFVFGDTYYQNYTAGKEDDLNNFIACFYYKRSGFIDTNIEKNARIIGLSNINTREAVATNYLLIREWLAESYPYVFQESKEGSKHNKSKGWVGVFDAIVGEDIVNQEKYAEKPLSIVLRYLNRKTKEYYKNSYKK